MLGSFRKLNGPLTLHHNLFASSRTRHPTIGSEPQESPEVVADYRNNVVYNIRETTHFGCCRLNAINNYLALITHHEPDSSYSSTTRKQYEGSRINSGLGTGRIVMPYAKVSPREVVSRGDEIYHRLIRKNVSAGDKGKFVIIDIETEEYEIDKDEVQATKRSLAKRPEAVLYGMRIGYPTAYCLGGHIASPEG